MLILVIDDDPTQQLLVTGILKKAGYDVIAASDGDQGLEKARRLKPDLVLCDVLMPGRNGFELVTAVRADRAIADLPVILLTSMADRAHVRQGMNSGADDYLAKPFTATELLEAVSALLARKRSQRVQVINELKAKFLVTIEDQKQVLAQQYEMKLAEALNSRWASPNQPEQDTAYAECTVLAVNLFGTVLQRRSADGDTASAVRSAYQSAKDTLFLFGARHIVTQGDDLLAVFVADDPLTTAASRAKALKAALGLSKGLPGMGGAGSGLAIALHGGPALLLHVTDPLHGETGTSLLTGQTVRTTGSLLEFAKASGWRVACSSAVLDGLETQARTGRRGPLPPAAGMPAAVEAVELLAVT